MNTQNSAKSKPNHKSTKSVPGREFFMPSPFKKNPAISDRQSIMKSLFHSKPSHGSENTDFNPRNYISSEFTEKDIIQIKDVFDSFDIDRNGIITPNDLRNSLQAFGFNAAKDTIYDIMAEFDENESGGLSFKEFLQMLMTRSQFTETRAEVQKVFSKYDYNRKGWISFEDLKKMGKELGEDIEEDEIEEMFKNADENGDGKMNFEEFYSVITKKVYY